MSSRATSRSRASSSQTLLPVMPLLVPSWLGFTMTGYRSGRSFSRPVTRTWNAGVSTSTRSRLARPLSRQIDSVAESLPVYGTPSSSQRLGTCASRLRPAIPSAMLKTTSTFDAVRARGKSGVASSGTTTWPWLSMACVIAWMVSGASYSASRSSPRVRLDALHVEGEADAQARPAGAGRSRLGGVEQRREAVAARRRPQDGQDGRVVIEARPRASRRRARRRGAKLGIAVALRNQTSPSAPTRKSSAAASRRANAESVRLARSLTRSRVAAERRAGARRWTMRVSTLARR